MTKKKHSTESPAFSLQLGKDVMSLMDTNSPIVNLFTEIGMTDWEIHMNQTMHFRDHEFKQELKKNEPSDKILEKNVGVKNPQNSDYWLG